jgi:hypothetical protein
VTQGGGDGTMRLSDRDFQIALCALLRCSETANDCNVHHREGTMPGVGEEKIDFAATRIGPHQIL